MGEGFSMGPLSDAMKAAGTRGILGNEDIHYNIEWTTLSEYLEYLVRRGVSTNLASFVGTSTLRIHAVGYDDRPPTPVELDKMRDLTREAMQGGAVGLSAALIYPPASYAQTDELIALAQIAADYGGMYISHLRSEGGRFLEALEELITIARETGIRAEIYHLKAAGRDNWSKMDEVIRRVETARAEGLPITADMYVYPAGGTGLAACIPQWAHEGGDAALLQRLKDPETRERIKTAMNSPSEWQNMWLEVDSPEAILLAGFKSEALKPLTGKTLAEVAAMRGTSPEDTLFDLIIEQDGARIFTMYFTMSEDNIRRQLRLPWVSFCSDAESLAPEGVFLKTNPHPRAYGNFARLLGHYVRDQQIIALEGVIRRLTSLPASNLRLDRRGALRPGYFADVVVFDPAAIQDHATFADPHHYATGMQHVFVNGVQVLKDGDHTGATSGRVVRGPGWQKR
jgi:N-acyl-D-amino-acid deacylase